MKVKNHVALMDEYQKAQAGGYVSVLESAENWANNVERLMGLEYSFMGAVNMTPIPVGLTGANFALAYLIRVWEHGEETRKGVVPKWAEFVPRPSRPEWLDKLKAEH